MPSLLRVAPVMWGNLPFILGVPSGCGGGDKQKNKNTTTMKSCLYSLHVYAYAHLGHTLCFTFCFNLHESISNNKKK